jgi:phosphohistidine phosphatase SixA
VQGQLSGMGSSFVRSPGRSARETGRRTEPARILLSDAVRAAVDQSTTEILRQVAEDQRRFAKYLFQASADARSWGLASNFGSNFSHAAARFAGKYSVGQ